MCKIGIRVSIFVLLTSLAARASTVNCRYDIQATLDQNGSTVKATAKMVYHNHGAKTLHELAFHFTPNQVDETISSEDSKLERVSSTFSVIDETGVLLQVQPLVDANGKVQEGCFVVKLGRPLEHGKSIQLETQSEARTTERYGIKHIKGCWHPKVVRRVGRDWQIGIEEFAHYRVTIGPLAQPLIPTSGASVQRQEDEDGLWTVTCEASNIPDFSMVFSRADHVISGTDGDVKINVFYLRDKDVAERMLNIAKDVIGFYRKMYGFYPDSILNIIAFDGRGFGGGPLGSNVVHVNKSFDQGEDGTIWGVAHEIAHQYWGWNWVTDEDANIRWLCLGMGLWSDRRYLEYAGKETQHSFYMKSYCGAVRKGRCTQLIGCGLDESKRCMKANDLAHSKGYAVAAMLEYLVGRKPFKRIARTVLSDYPHQVVTVDILQRESNRITGLDLNWFFSQWVKTNKALDYAVGKTTVEHENAQYHTLLLLDKKGPAVMPCEVLVEFADGTSKCLRVPVHQSTFTFVSDSPYRWIILDPNNRIADIDRDNNYMQNPILKPGFEILQIEANDVSAGWNILRVHARNTRDRAHRLFVHISVKVPQSRTTVKGLRMTGYARGHAYNFAPGQQRWVEHKFKLPDARGECNAVVSFTDPLTADAIRPSHLPPFLKKPVTLHFTESDIDQKPSPH